MLHWRSNPRQILATLRVVTGAMLVLSSLRLGFAFGHGGFQLWELFSHIRDWVASPALFLVLPVLGLLVVVMVDAAGTLRRRVTSASWFACALTGGLIALSTWNLWAFGNVLGTVGLPAGSWIAHTVLTILLSRHPVALDSRRGFELMRL